MIIALLKGIVPYFVVVLLLWPFGCQAQQTNENTKKKVIEIYTEADLEEVAPYYGIHRTKASAKKQTKTQRPFSGSQADQLLFYLKDTYVKERNDADSLQSEQEKIVDWYFSLPIENNALPLKTNKDTKEPKSINP